VLAVVATVGAIVPVIGLVYTAHRYGAVISWTDHLDAAARFKAAPPDQTILYGTIETKKLYAGIYLPANPTNRTSAPALMMHGGGYVSGGRSMAYNWDRWLSPRGHTVFDIDYRLAPPPTWNQAAQDATCAMVWIAGHADEYHIDPGRMLLARQSAGAGPALQAAYGLGDGTVRSSCGGTVPKPKAVFALYPPDDFALGWNMKTKSGTARAFLKAYIGGTPQDFPDHLVPFEGHLELVEELKQADVPNELIDIPYSEHAYDVIWGSLGGQITRHALGAFLDQYLPATEYH
jgi:acetyl esterase/lipase